MVEFHDANGFGHCQTDLMLEGERAVLVMEAKLSWVTEGHSQLELLYRPVVEAAMGKPMLGIVVTKHLRPEMPRGLRVVSTLAQAVDIAKTGRSVVLHWLGSGLLGLSPPVRDGGAYLRGGASRANT